MSKKKASKTSANLPAIRIGSRIRCTDDGVTGRIVWANAVAVKIKWDDGEQVTWKRESLATRPIEILDADDSAQTETTPEPTPVEQVVQTAVNAEPASEAASETPAVEQNLGVPAANPPQAAPASAADALAGPDARPDWEVALETARPAPSGADAPPAEIPTEAPAKTKRQRKPKTEAEPKVKKPSALDAAAKVLGEAGTAMTCKEMIGAMAAKGYWTSPGGKTPDATLCSAILREINVKGEQSRFVKAAPGRFAVRPTA
jgi:hypothetical protein